MQNKIIFALLAVIIIIISAVGSILFLNKHPSSGQDGAPLPVSGNISGIEITDSVSIKQEPATTTETAPKVLESDAFLYTGIKQPGRVVVIDIVKFVKDGYIVIYENTLEPTGELLGVSSFLRTEEYTNIPITC